MNKSLPLFFTFFLFKILFTNAQTINWARQGGGPGVDLTRGMAFDKAGNSYIVGSNSLGGKFENIALAAGGVLVKYNSAGEIVWGKAFPVNEVTGICVDNDNQIYIIGAFSRTLTLGGISITPHGDTDAFIAKLDEDGNVIWVKSIGGSRVTLGNGIAVDKNQDVYVIGSVTGPAFFDNILIPGAPGSNDAFYAKFNADGSFNFSKRLPGGAIGKDIELDAAGNAYILGDYRGSLDLSAFGFEITPWNGSGLFLTKFSSRGQLQWLKTSQPSASGHQVMTGGLALDKLGNCFILGSYSGKLALNNSQLPTVSFWKSFLAKFDTKTGNDIWLKQSAVFNHIDRNTMGVDSVGNIFLGGSVEDGQIEDRLLNYGKNEFIIAKYNPLGKLSWAQGIHTDKWAVVLAVVLSKDGKVGVSGGFNGSYNIPGINQSGDADALPDEIFPGYDILTTVLEDNTASLNPNQISGTVFEDLNGNCLQDNGEFGIKGLIVKAEPGPYFGLTDSVGHFSISVDTGTYTIAPVFPELKKNTILESCITSRYRKVVFKKYNQKEKEVNFGYLIKECSQLTVDIAADRRRRCLRSKTTVTYSNEGTADAQNVQIKVLYPRYVVPLKSSLAWASRQDSVMFFDIGTLKAGERRSFVITDSTVCGNEAIRGLSQCVKAFISPKNTCASPSSEWDQSSVVVEASLTEQDQVASFTIANEGQGDMSDSTAYRLYANEALAKQGKVKLAKGARARLAVPDPRATLRLEADQVPRHPGMSRPVASLQPAMVSPAMAAPSPIDGSYQDDADAEVSVSCLPIIDSFDPNDKQVSPQGISRRHYIKAEDELEYQIRFQNTGTDTAYTVVVKDTLSPYVDVSSLQIGSASHPFTYTVSGKGSPVLTFTFKNINLPDHKKNEPASHGYVRFRIAQTPGNPRGTVIRNLAYNYFDFNSPIATNEVYNIIGDTTMAPLVPLMVYDCGKQLPTAALAGEEIRLCETSETVLQANAPQQGIGRWRILSGQATLSDPASPRSRLTEIGYGEVVLEWSISLCEVVSRSQVKVWRYPIPAAPEMAVPALQCEGSQLQPLRAAGSNITWYADAEKQQKLYMGNGFIPQIQATTTFYASQTVNGCESPVAAVEVKIHPARLSFAVNQDTLVAPPADSYQWYFNGQPLEGATGQRHFPRNTGSYNLQATTQGCVSTSEAMAIAKNHPQAILSLGPNPASGRLHLELTANETGPVHAVIWDRLGREVRSYKAFKTNTVHEQILELGNLSAGLYLLEVQVGQQVLTRKFVQK